jgi:DNA-binding FadR family transcriptional regulator
VKNESRLPLEAAAPSNGDETLRLVRVPKTAEIVADHIRGRIIRGDLKEGDFLPPEGQLMATLGISRPTLREAFRVLETERLISIVRGSRSGAQVHRPRVTGVSRYAGFVLQSQGTTIADIYDARLAIEPFLARRLAEQRPEGATDLLRAEADRLTELAEEGRYIDFMIGLAGFHRLLVEVSGNRTLLFLTQVLQDVLARHQVEFFKLRVMPDEEQRRRSLWGIRSFRKLIELVDAGDAAGAETHWRLHITNANASWVPDDYKDKVIDVLS